MDWPTIELAAFTHYTREVKTAGQNWFRLFRIEPCDVCGEACEAANSVQVSPTGGERVLVLAGLQYVSSRLGELSVTEETGECVCESCYHTQA